MVYLVLARGPAELNQCNGWDRQKTSQSTAPSNVLSPFGVWYSIIIYRLIANKSSDQNKLEERQRNYGLSSGWVNNRGHIAVSSSQWYVTGLLVYKIHTMMVNISHNSLNPWIIPLSHRDLPTELFYYPSSAQPTKLSHYDLPTEPSHKAFFTHWRALPLSHSALE